MKPENGASVNGVSIRRMGEGDLEAAERIMRLAFGTFTGAPDPETFMGDSALLRPRWLADPSGAFCAEQNGQIVGSNYATHWGSVGFFGPLTVHPDYWDKGIGKRLIEPAIQCFNQWQTTFTGLYTFSASPKHAALYQKFGFWPGYLTAIMSKTVYPAGPAVRWSRFSGLSASEQTACLKACQELTGSVYSGLDVSLEVKAVSAQRLGDTVLLWEDRGLSGLAVCHSGPGSEAGSGSCYIKFGAVRPGHDGEQAFTALITAAETLAGILGASRLTAGVNTARRGAYRRLIDLGFRTDFQGVAMHRPDEPGYNRPDVFLIDDWR